MLNSIVTTLPSEIVHVPFFQVLDNLSLEEITQIKMNVNLYPTNSQLLKTFLENSCWDEFKQMLMSEVRTSNKIKKITNAHTFRDSAQIKQPNMMLLKHTLNEMRHLTGLTESSPVNRKKSNKKMLRSIDQLRLPELKPSSKNFIELNKMSTNIYSNRAKFGNY